MKAIKSLFLVLSAGLVGIFLPLAFSTYNSDTTRIFLRMISKDYIFYDMKNERMGDSLLLLILYILLISIFALFMITKNKVIEKQVLIIFFCFNISLCIGVLLYSLLFPYDFIV